MCRRLMTDHGHTVVVLVPPAGRTYADEIRRFMPAAYRAGLRYLEHVVAVTVPQDRMPAT
jgi:hypothetical protein